MENKQINADNQITFLDNDVANNFDISKQTGKLMFKFDDEEPQQCASVLDYGKVKIELRQQKGINNAMQQLCTCLQFTSKSGKTFKLYIENYDQNETKA